MIFLKQGLSIVKKFELYKNSNNFIKKNSFRQLMGLSFLKL